ncbi:MAG: hypothetical protein HPY45_02725 [Anaerolineae bacterium]|nr:hypothetical protein [Anaerolineae bacterium]
MPIQYFGKEEQIAIRLNIHALDARQEYLQTLPEGARFSGLTCADGHHNLIRMLIGLTDRIHPSDCLLVYNLDLLVLGLDVNERERFWREVLEGLPYPRTKLILSVPDTASQVFPLVLQQEYPSRIARGDWT